MSAKTSVIASPSMPSTTARVASPAKRELPASDRRPTRIRSSSTRARLRMSDAISSASPQLGACNDLLDRVPHLVTADEAIHGFLRPRAGEDLLDSRIERAGLRQLESHALEDVVFGDRARELLGQVARESTVDQLREFGDEMLVRSGFDRTPGNPCGGARGEEREPSCGPEPGAAAVSRHPRSGSRRSVLGRAEP